MDVLISHSTISSKARQKKADRKEHGWGKYVGRRKIKIVWKAEKDPIFINLPIFMNRAFSLVCAGLDVAMNEFH